MAGARGAMSRRCHCHSRRCTHPPPHVPYLGGQRHLLLELALTAQRLQHARTLLQVTHLQQQRCGVVWCGKSHGGPSSAASSQLSTHTSSAPPHIVTYQPLEQAAPLPRELRGPEGQRPEEGLQEAAAAAHRLHVDLLGTRPGAGEGGGCVGGARRRPGACMHSCACIQSAPRLLPVQKAAAPSAPPGPVAPGPLTGTRTVWHLTTLSSALKAAAQSCTQLAAQRHGKASKCTVIGWPAFKRCRLGRTPHSQEPASRCCPPNHPSVRPTSTN